MPARPSRPTRRARAVRPHRPLSLVPVFVAAVDGAFAATYALIILDSLAKRGTKAGVVEDVAVLPEFQGNDEFHPKTVQAA